MLRNCANDAGTQGRACRASAAAQVQVRQHRQHRCKHQHKQREAIAAGASTSEGRCKHQRRPVQSPSNGMGDAGGGCSRCKHQRTHATHVMDWPAVFSSVGNAGANTSGGQRRHGGGGTHNIGPCRCMHQLVWGQCGKVVCSKPTGSRQLFTSISDMEILYKTSYLITVCGLPNNRLRL